ncbi:unnamed protein product [Sphagnum jensenii]|uniref:Uncharacterized protein n=1 Tax=Sphagnum jensenii TaxID=128206 RepID=A0ABP0VA88_9BRYO
MKNIEGAQIYAENSIRKKNEYLNYLRLASRIDAVYSKVKSAVAMQSVARNIGSVTKSLESAMASLDLEKISKIMDQFEKQFTDLDVESGRTGEQHVVGNDADNTARIGGRIDKASGEENNLEIMSKVNEAPGTAGLATVGASGVATGSRSREEDETLTRRLASLRN